MKDSGNNSSRCRIVVDAMGGDFAPTNAVLGAIEAFNELKSFDLYLVGQENKISEVFSANQITFSKDFIITADEIACHILLTKLGMMKSLFTLYNKELLPELERVSTVHNKQNRISLG